MDRHPLVAQQHQPVELIEATEVIPRPFGFLPNQKQGQKQDS